MSALLKPVSNRSTHNYDLYKNTRNTYKAIRRRKQLAFKTRTVKHLDNIPREDLRTFGGNSENAMKPRLLFHLQLSHGSLILAVCMLKVQYMKT